MNIINFFYNTKMLLPHGPPMYSEYIQLSVCAKDSVFYSVYCIDVELSQIRIDHTQCYYCLLTIHNFFSAMRFFFLLHYYEFGMHYIGYYLLHIQYRCYIDGFFGL